GRRRRRRGTRSQRRSEPCGCSSGPVDGPCGHVSSRSAPETVRRVTPPSPAGLPYAARPANNGGVSDSPAQPIIGVDVGGTKVAAAAIEGPHAAHLTEAPTDLRH